MKERLTNNLGLEVLAIFLALFLWLIVSSVSSPVKQGSKEVVVDIINKKVLAESNLIYEVMGKSSIMVYYDIHTLDAYRISSSDFYAYTDLSELYDMTNSIPVKIDIVDDEGLISETPATKPGVVRIETEEVRRKPFKLQVRNKAGAPAGGYATGEITLTPRVIHITGPVPSIGQINSIGVDIATDSEATDDYTATTAPVFYDVNGSSPSIGSDVTLNTTEIIYRVTMLKARELGLDFQVRGNVADGYRFTGVGCDMKSVSVESIKSALTSLNTLVIPSEYLNPGGATSDVVVQVNLTELLPGGVAIAGSGEVMAMVTLRVGPLEIRGFKVELTDAELTGASDELKYESNVANVQVDTEGLSEDLDTLNERDLKPVIDVSHMAEGEHRGALALTPGSGFEIISMEDFEIIVTAKDPANSSTSPNDMTKDSGDSTKKTTKESTEEATKTSWAGNRTSSSETIRQRQEKTRGMAYGQ